MIRLLSLAILLFTSTDLAVSQRKVSRNIQVGADIKTVNTFACPEEFGYYPHPNDCTQYYVCVYGGALLESCTGGLMYSHELQTCDWPRNVGCDGGDAPAAPATAAPRREEAPRQRYTPPPAQPAAVVTSRGQPRQLHHNQEIIKQRQQQQLYADAEDTLPPAEEVENDRQQRVYRGQPSTLGQVQKDRDGIRHTNAISGYSGRGERIGVISFGTQQAQAQPQQQYSDNFDVTNDLTLKRRRKRQTAPRRVEQSSAAPVQQPSISTATATARTLYNSTQYNGNYDPYYAIYDDDVELYKDVDYSQHYNSAQQPQAPQQSYRRTPAPAVQSTTTEDQPKRASYVQNSYNSQQDIYQPATVQDYSDDNSYNSQVDDQNSFRQVNNRQPSRGDRNDLNYIEEATTKRTTSTTIRKPTTTTIRTTTSTTTLRTIPPKKSTFPSRAVTEKEQTHYTLRDDPGQNPTPSNSPISSLRLDTNDTFRYFDTIPQSGSINAAVVNKPAPFTLPEHLITTQKPILFHYVTKPSRSTTLVSTELPLKITSTTAPTTTTPQALNKFIVKTKNSTVIIPTTYSPPKFFLKSLLSPKTVITPSNPDLNSQEPVRAKTLKFIRKLISPITVNYGLGILTGTSYESAEKLVSDVDVVNIKAILPSTTTTTTTTSTTVPTTLKPEESYEDDYIELESKLRGSVIDSDSSEKRFRNTVEIPRPHDLIENEFNKPKSEPDQSPDYKLKPIPKPILHSTTTTTDSPQNSSVPARVSRVNNAIKSMIAFGGTRIRQNVKCHESSDSKCNDPKQQRTSTRGRGSAHYANSPNVANNEVTVTVNRGTPPSRSRPTLKPSTSIVSKAAEFIDIYRFPPVRPEALYPQPQPDKTAAKCRKDVCLLPDCSCGGKEIPGDIPEEQVPQMVLLTFDDSVNDLNKGLYSDLFEKGRTNPNGCPIAATFYVSHEWTDYSQVQNLYSDGHEIASHTVSHSFGEQFSQKKWTREIAGQREILSAYGGVHLEDVRGMRAPFLSVGGNKMFKMLYDSNFTYDSSMPIYENKPPSWPYTLDYKLFHDCMIPPCPTRSYPGVWEVPMVMWQDLNGGRCSMGDACSNPPDSEGVFKMLTKNFQRHYTTNRAPFGLFYHAAWFTQPHHKEGFINFLDSILAMKDVWLVTNWQAIQWQRDPTPTSRLGAFQPFQCDFSDRPKRCNNPKVCNLWHKSGVRYMRTCQPCPDIYPWTGNSGIRSSRIDNDIED